MELWQLDKILFIDIETASEKKEFAEIEEQKQKLWQHKAQYLKQSDSDTAAALYEQKASIFAEFGKIVCIGFGYFTQSANGLQFRVKAFDNIDEATLLQEFQQIIEKHFNDSKKYVFCGHNIREFDLPYISRRMLINNILIPDMLETRNKRPFDIAHIDTMQLWKFGDYKNFTSLDLLANVLQVPSSKSDISGADVGRVYWQENDLARIVAYCKRDIVTTARVYQRLCNLPIIADENVHLV